MLTWLAFSGKVIEYIATKLLGKQLDLARDDRKRACLRCINFLDAFDTLHARFSAFLHLIDSFAAGRNTKLYRSHLDEVTRDLQSASDEFLRNLSGLIKAISVM